MRNTSLYKNLHFILLLLLLSSCGYRFGHGGISETYYSFSVPYVEGDRHGRLTGAIIRELSTRGSLAYCQSGADLILRVTILNISEENIGFRYDRDKIGDVRNAVIPSESRISGFVEVTVVDTETCCEIMGPIRISASVDYDHDYVAGPEGVNIFSLGQLTDQDTARDAVKRPLHEALAEKIVDYVSNAWW